MIKKTKINVTRYYLLINTKIINYLLNVIYKKII